MKAVIPFAARCILFIASWLIALATRTAPIGLIGGIAFPAFGHHWLRSVFATPFTSSLASSRSWP